MSREGQSMQLNITDNAMHSYIADLNEKSTVELLDELQKTQYQVNGLRETERIILTVILNKEKYKI